MTRNEFTILTNLTPTNEGFNQIHLDYINKGVDKQIFCTQFLQSIRVSKKEKTLIMKELKNRLTWCKQYAKESIKNNVQCSEMEEQSFLIVDTNGEIHSFYSGTNLEELNRIKLTKIAYIVSFDVCETKDTESGCISFMYRNLDTEYVGMIQNHIDNTIKCMQDNIKAKKVA